MQTRREFIAHTAYGALATVILERAFGSVAAAAPDTGYVFFTLPQAETIAAMADRIWPPTPDAPGAAEAGSVTYIDRALAGYQQELKHTYRRGIDALNAYANEKAGDLFSALPAEQQDQILKDLEQNAEGARRFFLSPTAPEFFRLVHRHTLEGLFADPIHGGNKDFAGWKAIGYPGPRFLYTAQMQTTFAPLDLPLQSVADL